MIPTPGSDFPPVAHCLRCGEPTCDGCRAPSVREACLAWQTPDRQSVRSCWLTACQTVESWRSWPGQPQLFVRRALAFALIAELGAASSLAACCLLVVLVFLPDAVWPLLWLPTTWLWLSAMVSGFAVVMVLLHVSWAVSLEGLLFISGLEVQWRSGLCFGLYACGWDLVTSPLGVMLSLLTRGRSAGLRLVKQAMLVPRAASEHYLVTLREAPPQNATALGVGSLALPLLLTAAFSASVGWFAWLSEWS